MTTFTQESIAALRREIHSKPEPGWAEFVSSARAIEKLESLGFTVKCGREVINPDFIRGANRRQIEEGLAFAKSQGVKEEILERLDGVTGVVGLLETGRPGPVMAIRFELDELCGTLKLLFQPAEEGVRGARPMAESGIVDDVDFLYCGHLGCDIPGGTVVTAPEKFLCTTKLDYRFRGTPSHAGMQPEVGRNALMAAAGAAMSLMALPRHGEGMTRVNVGYLRAGEGRNVIASTAEMQVEVRGETAKINTYMYEEAKARVQGAAAMYGVSVEEEVMGEAVDFVPDLPLRDAAAEVAKNAPYVDKVQTTMNFNGSDDATVLIKRVQEKGGQGAYLVVGSDLAAGHHQSAFDFEEKHLLTLFTIYRDLILRHLGAH